jgi:predicted O-methyltransferase YrrM
MATPIDELLDEIRERMEGAQDAINTLVRTQVAQGLAPLFLEKFRPYEGQERLSAWIDQGLLNRAAFMQKSPELLQFYRRLLPGIEPRRIFEIGVKGGGSTVFWKQLFPAATVVGMDIKLRSWLSDDGVIYVQGDQSDAAQLTKIAVEHGPFDIVIDDGSHVSDHQAISLRTLVRHVHPGGLYVVEDTHKPLKGTYGDDIWPDVVTTLFQQLRRGPASADSVGSRLALDVFPMTEDVIVSAQTLAIRTRRPRQ